jgi:hypothetical protein
VIVRYFNVDRTFGGPYETDSVLVVYSDRVLSFPIAFESLQVIARPGAKIVQAMGGVQHFQLSASDPDRCRKSFRDPAMEKRFRALVFEALYHGRSKRIII